MHLTTAYKARLVRKVMKFSHLNLIRGEKHTKVTVMSNHLKKDVGLPTEESDSRHYSSYL